MLTRVMLSEASPDPPTFIDGVGRDMIIAKPLFSIELYHAQFRSQL